MAEKIARMQQITGNKADLPNLLKGELALCDDVDEVYIGNGSKNVEVATEKTLAPLADNIFNENYPIPGINYTKASYDDFVTSLSSIGATTVNDLGESTLTGKNIYGLTIGDCDGGKPIIYIQGQIHGGHEWRTAYWVREFAKMLAQQPKNLPYSGLLKLLRDNFDFYIIPCLNPYGYTNNTYTNGNGVSISRNFDYNWASAESGESTEQYKGTAAWSEPEAQIVKTAVEAYNPIAFFCCHTLGEYEGYSDHTIRPANNSDHIYIFQDIVQTLNKLLGLAGSSIGATSNPTAYNWALSRSSFGNEEMYACGFETGALLPEYDQARAGINGLMQLCLKVLNKQTIRHYWFNNGSPTTVKWTQVATGSATNMKELTHLRKTLVAPFTGLATLKIQCTTSNNAATLGKNVMAPILHKGDESALTQAALNAFGSRAGVFQIHTNADDRKQYTMFYSIPVSQGDNIIAGVQAGTGAADTEGSMQRFRAELIITPGSTISSTMDYSGETPVRV